MVESYKSSNDAEQSNRSQDNGRPYGHMYWVYIIGAWSLIGLLLVAIFWPGMTERLKFFVGTLWVIVTAFAVIAQAVIYRKQWSIMERQLQFLARSESAYLSVGDLEIPLSAITILSLMARFLIGRKPLRSNCKGEFRLLSVKEHRQPDGVGSFGRPIQRSAKACCLWQAIPYTSVQTLFKSIHACSLRLTRANRLSS